MDRLRRHWPLLVALTVGAVLRVWLFAEHAGHPLSDLLRLDESQYAQTAVEAAAGAILPDYVRTNAPGYSLFLAPFFAAMRDPLALIRLAQMALGLASAALAYFLALRLFRRRAAAAGAAILAGLYWPALIFEQHLLSVTLFVFLNLLGLLLATRAEPATGDATPSDASEKKSGLPSLAASGLVFGLAVLTVPTALAPVAFIAAGLAFGPGRPTRVRLARTAVFIVAALAPVLPFVIADRARTGEWFLLQTNGGLNFYLGNGPESDGTPWARPGGSWDALTSMPVRAGAESYSAQDRYFTGRALAFAADEPGRLAALLGRKAMLTLNRREVYATIWPEFHRHLFLATRLPLPGFGIILALAAAGLLTFPRGPAGRLLLLYLAGYFIALTATVVSSRYRLPLAAGLWPLAGAGVMEFWRLRKWTIVHFKPRFKLRLLLRPREGRREIAALLLAAAGGLIAWVPLSLPHTNKMLSEELATQAEAYVNQGKVEEGERYARSALAADRRSALAYLQLARAAVMQDRLDESLSYLRQAAEADPQSSEARYQYAFALSAKGDLPAALLEMRAAVEDAPQRVNALMGLAEIAARSGKIDEARDALARVDRLRPGFAPAREFLREIDAVYGTGGSP